MLARPLRHHDGAPVEGTLAVLHRMTRGDYERLQEARKGSIAMCEHRSALSAR